MAPAHALLLLGATADLFCSLVKPPEEKTSDDLPVTSKVAAVVSPASNNNGGGECVPQVKISPSRTDTSKERKPSINDFSFKHKLSSLDSLSQNKVYRTGSQTKRKVSPSDALPLSRMSVSEPRFQRRISLSDMPHGQVMLSKSVPIRHPTNNDSLNISYQQIGPKKTSPQPSKLSQHSAYKRPAYQFRSLSTEIPSPSYSPMTSKHNKPVGSVLPSHQMKDVTSSDTELKFSYSDISPKSYHVRSISRDS